MVFFVHIVTFDRERDLAMTLGRTRPITEAGAEPRAAAGLGFLAG